MNNPITVEAHYAASPKKVWQALTTVTQIKQWFHPAVESFKAEKGFTTSFVISHNAKDWDHLWEITEAVPYKRLSIRWQFRGYKGDSTVSLELFPDPTGTHLVLTHSGLETFPKEVPELSVESHRQGWQEIIQKTLKSEVENGRQK